MLPSFPSQAELVQIAETALIATVGGVGFYLIGFPGGLVSGSMLAVAIAAEKISACEPGKYGMLISADCSNETLYVARKFVREVAGSSYLRTSSTAPHGDSLYALQRLYACAQPLSVLSEADVILCAGFDGKYVQSIVDAELHRG